MKLLDPARTSLLVVDLQEAFRTAIPDFEMLVVTTATAVRGCRVLGLPVIVTEQYPNGLGHTAEEISLSLGDDPTIFEKTMFGAGSDDVIAKLRENGRDQVLLAGIETHICINQTAHLLLAAGFDVRLLVDCVGSRFTRDRDTALTRLFQAGVIPATVEMSLFELMRDSRHPAFREIQKLIK